MEASSSGKISSHSNRSGSSKVLHVTEGKPRKSRKKKKNRRGHGKSEMQSGIKLASDEEKGAHETNRVRTLEVNCKYIFLGVYLRKTL